MEGNNRKVFRKLILTAISVVLCCMFLFAGCSEEVDDGSISEDDKTLQEAIYDDNFESLSDDEKLEKIEQGLNDMAKKGIIDENSIKYDESNKMFTFNYSDGSLGGVSIKEFGDEINGAMDICDPTLMFSSIEPSEDDGKDTELDALILNGFEDKPYRRDYYDELKQEWDKRGVNTTVDVDVTVDDLKNISNKEIVVLAMHGGTYEGSPVLVINQKVTKKTDEKYKFELDNGMIAKVTHGLFKSYYYILPDFFRSSFDNDELQNKFIFSESCQFFGCDCNSTTPDYSLASAIEYSSTATVVGYHNSVGADYSRDVMKYTIDEMLDGYNLTKALNSAKDEYGSDDDWQDEGDDKYRAYPLIYGDSNAVIVKVAATDFNIDSERTISIGKIDIIEPVFVPETANDYEIKWESSDDNVATVSQDGILTGKKEGKITITATVTSNENTIEKTMSLTVTPLGRDTVLVLDVSGSMSGKPIDELKKSAEKFCKELLKDGLNNRVGIVCYDSYVETVALTNDLQSLIDYINGLDSGSRTDMESGLVAAEEMLDLDESKNIKNVVIMADGLPNEGRTLDTGALDNYSYDESQYANAVVDTANRIMQKYNMYSLGFFHDLSGEALNFATDLMKLLTNMPDGYREVDEAENLQFAFGDVQEDISDGSRIVINIACPVDVKVTYNNETLSSNDRDFCGRTSFGSLQLLGQDQDVKVLTLEPGIDYDIQLIGTGIGTMDYSVQYYDEDDQVTDYREFESVPVTPTTLMSTSTAQQGAMDLDIDKDGDGTVDEIWSADEKAKATVTKEDTTSAEPESSKKTDDSKYEPWQWALIIGVPSVVILLLIIILCVTISNNKKTKAQLTMTPQSSIPSQPVKPPVQPARPPVPVKPAPEPVEMHTFRICISDDAYDRSYSISPGQTYCIGKDKVWSDIILPDKFRKISRKHCRVSYDVNRRSFVVNDLSKNGLRYSDDKKLNSGVNYIKDGTTIYFSDRCCSIVFEK